MAVSVSIVLVLALAVLVLHKFGGLRLWHGFVCALFGLYLGTTRFGALIREVVVVIAQTVAGIAS